MQRGVEYTRCVMPSSEHGSSADAGAARISVDDESQDVTRDDWRLTLQLN